MFRKFFDQVLGTLGLRDKFESRSLSPDEQAAIIKAYEELAGSKFSDGLRTHLEEQERVRAAEERAEAFKTLATSFGVEVDESTDTVATLAAIQSTIEAMNTKIEKLGAQAEPDAPQDHLAMETTNISGAHTKDHAFGVPHALFAAGKRHNRIAITGRIEGEASESDRQAFKDDYNSFTSSLSQRVSELSASGALRSVVMGQADYSLLEDAEIGTRYIVRRQDALIAQISTLPSLKSFFQTRSNIQDGDILTNVLFGELSQAYQPGRVSKGSYKFLPEKAHVDKVMFKHVIEDMTWIETNYLGYLNTSGSDPVKWSMIEWLVLQFAKQLVKEANHRQMLGYRVDPVAGVAGAGTLASTGVVQSLVDLYDKHLKVLPFFDSSLTDLDVASIGETLESFMAEVAERVDDARDYVVYLSDKFLPLFKSWYTTTYGTNANFDGVVLRVPNYDNPLVFLPEMGGLKMVFATKPGNIQLLENVPGEQVKMRFQQDLEAVWVASYWKEGVGFTFTGAPKEDKAALAASDGADQVVFFTLPMTAVAADATTVDGRSEMFFRTGTNTAATALTDITNAREDVVYRIEIGDATFPTSIAKSGKFGDISAAWTPTAVGEYIKLWYDGTKFHDVERG